MTLLGDVTADTLPRVSTRPLRRRMAAVTILTTIALLAGLVILAVSADGREESRASSNDGGAWLVNRELAVVGHRNRAAGELSASMRVANSPTADLFQARNVVVVHDAASNQLIEVDTRSFNEDLEPTQLPEFTRVDAVDDAVLVIRHDPLSLWRIDRGALPTLTSLDAVAPLFSNESTGRVAATPQGTIAVLDTDNELLQWYFSDGTASAVPVPVELAGDVVDLTIVDSSAVLLLDSGDLIVVGPDEVEHRIAWQDLGEGRPPLARLQQPSALVDSRPPRAAVEVVGITAQGDLFAIGLDLEAPRLASWGSMSGDAPLAPIVHDGCIFAVVVEPAQYGISCGELVERPLEGASQELRLRLVNGSVWVNDLEDGGTWMTTDDLRVQAVDDWSFAEEQAASDTGDAGDDGGGDGAGDVDEIIEEDPDAEGEVRTSEDFDPTKENTPPVAVDDFARTRVDRAAVVPVLANDSDANNDILVVTSVELLSGDALVSVASSQEEVQVTPVPGFVGTVTLNYSISDGRSDPVSAMVTVEVLASNEFNAPPQPTTDVVATAPGNTTTVDVLLNDVDPDGDAISLAAIEAETGTLRWAPSGQVTFTPDSNSAAGWIDIAYVVTDDLGAEATGQLRVEIRDQGANQEPDARNDHGVTVVSQPVVLQLLANDSDPDGDPLIVGSRPVLLEPEMAEVLTSVTSDGEFVFATETEGTYLFSYTITDSADGGSESDTARIRIDVEPKGENEPPVALRDDIVIPVGQTRTAFVLDNDGDPGGDVVSIVSWQSAPGLVIEPVEDASGHVGFQITAAPDAPELAVFQYSISDGVNPPVSAPVVVAVVNQTPRDQPPFAFDDVVEARAGSTISGFAVLANDFDPEGGALRVVRVDAGAGATSISADGQTVDIEIPADAVSSYSLPYDVEDEAGSRAAAVIRVQLIPADAPNRPPTARADVARTTLGVSTGIDVLANDSDPDADLIAIEGIVEQPAHGVATLLSDGSVNYQPDPGYTGSDLFRYAVVDVFGDRGIGTVSVGVVDLGSANRPPIANDDSYELNGVPSVLPLDVRANDFDPDNDPLRLINVTDPTVGAAVIDEFGRLTFLPPASLAEPVVVTFEYTIVDIAGNQASATVSISLDAYDELLTLEQDAAEAPTPEPTVEEIVEVAATPTPAPTPEPDPEEEIDNEPPVAINDDRGPVREGTEVRVEVLVNDFDPDGPTSDLTVVEIREISGIAWLEDNVVVTVAGTETIQAEYTIEDAFGAQATALVTVLVTDNQGPDVEPFSATAAFETAIELDLSNQASDVDGDELFFVCCENIRNGRIENVVAEAGVFTLTFVPNNGFFGQAGFAYVVDDQQGHQTAGSASITVNPPDNQAPVATEDTLRLPQGVVRAVDLTRYSGDPDGDELTREIIEPPAEGGISVRIDGEEALVEIGRNVAVGTIDSFTYEISDGSLSTVGTLSIEVIAGENQAPIAQDITSELTAGSSLSVDLSASSSDLDPGDFLTWSIGSIASDSGIDLVLNGSLLQIFAETDAAGTTAQVDYTATDSRGVASSALITINVNEPTSPLPIANDDQASTNERTIVSIPVLDNDTDPLGEGLIIIAADASVGTATFADQQLLVFDPGTNVGTATITYTIRDGANREASATVTVETLGVPDIPAPPSVEAGNELVIIQWDTPQSNGSELLGYIITSSEGIERRIPVQNSYTWDELENGTDYTFTVAAENGIGESDPSDPSEIVTPDLLPEKPAAPQVEFRDEALFVTWATPADNGGSELQGYELEIGGNLSDVEPIAATATSFLWQGLENGLEYTFRLRAENQTDFGPWSDLSPSERPEGQPSQMSAPSAERGSLSGELLITWPALGVAQQNGGEILEYRVTASTGVSVDTGSTALEYSWSDLPTGEPITFQVQARNRSVDTSGTVPVPLWSPLSLPSGEAVPCGVPNAPETPSVVRGDGEVIVTFVELTVEEANGCQPTNYIIRAYDLDLGGITPIDAAGSPETVRSLDNGTRYAFDIRAVNDFGTGDPSAQSATVIPAGPPICAQPSNVTATASGVGEITVTWNAASDNGDGPVTYEIDRGAGFQPADGIDELEIFTGLSNGTLVDFAVRAVNGVDASPECGSASATTWDLPSALTVSSSYDGTRLLWIMNGGIATNPPLTSWTTTMTGYAGACPVSATVLQDGDECYTLASAPTITNCFEGWISEFGRCAYYYEGSGRSCTAHAPAPVNLQSAYCWYRPDSTQPECPPGTTDDPSGGCRLPVDTSDLLDCGGCTPVVASPPSTLTGVDTPLPQTRSEPISIEGQYFLEVEVCNPVGCVDNLDIAASPPPLAPGTPSEYVNIGGVPDLIYPGDYYLSGFGCNCFESIQRTSLVMFESELPEDNGLPITGVAWEFRRGDLNFGAPAHGLLLENSGVLPWQSPAMSVDVDPRFGWGRHPTGVNFGETHYPYVRMAAINSAGQAEWSQWLFGSVVGAQDPYIEIESSVEQTGCSFAAECHTFTGFLMRFGVSETYTVELINIETGENAPRPCLELIPTDSIGRAAFTITCDTGEDPTDIRLRVDGYLSQESGHTQSTPDLWYTVPG